MIEGGVEERELCWYGDVEFVPHLLKALGTPGFSAEVIFGEPRVYPDRRTVADATRAEIIAMRAAGCYPELQESMREPGVLTAQ